VSAAGPCQAYFPELDDLCGQPGPLVRRGCVHEHISDGYCCDYHQAMVAEGGCLECFKAGHECPITLTPIEGGTP
jgi:hypothetical protein